jgi:hypothetical protein
MPIIDSNRSRRAIALPALLLVSIAVAACGGASSAGTGSSASVASTHGTVPSSTSTSTTASTPSPAAPAKSATTTATAPGAAAAPAPSHSTTGTATAPRSSSHSSTHGHRTPNVGTLAGAIEACVEHKGAQACGVSGGSHGSPAGSIEAGTGKHSVAKFTECLRANGVAVPSAGHGTGVNTATPEFKAAEEKCLSTLDGGT